MSKSLAVLVLTLPAANAVYSWNKGNKLCAGIKVPCTDGATCSTTAVGPCPDGAKPAAYLESEFQGLAFVDSKKYLDAKTGNISSDATTYYVVEASGPGFRDYKDNLKMDTGGNVAFSMVGSVFGDTGVAGGYVGLVSSLNTGTETLEGNSVQVFTAATGQAAVDRSGGTDWSDSDIGAPNGPYEVCISEIKADKTCGAKLSLKPGELSFSIFGGLLGTDYDSFVKAGVGNLPTGTDKMGVRMQLKATGFAVKDLKVNGKSWEASMVNDDVTSMFIMHESGGLNIEFPKKYNTGSTEGAVIDEALTNTATHDMAIRISTDPAAQTIMIDYLFDISKITMNTWFICGSAVSQVAKGSADPNAPAVGSGKSAANTYTIATATFSAIAAVVGLLM